MAGAGWISDWSYATFGQMPNFDINPFCNPFLPRNPQIGNRGLPFLPKSISNFQDPHVYIPCHVSSVSTVRMLKILLLTEQLWCHVQRNSLQQYQLCLHALRIHNKSISMARCDQSQGSSTLSCGHARFGGILNVVGEGNALSHPTLSTLEVVSQRILNAKTNREA